MTTTRQLLAAAIASTALLSAGAAFAQEATPDTWLQTSSVQTRAAVVADAAAARQNGLAQSWNEGYIAPLQSTTPRAEVRNQTLQAIRSGEVKAINAEVYSQLPATTLRVAQAG
jgi:hypothetical protein